MICSSLQFLKLSSIWRQTESQLIFTHNWSVQITSSLQFNLWLKLLAELPLVAPSILTFLIECTCCFVVGDFLIYSEHRIMHIIPFLRLQQSRLIHFDSKFILGSIYIMSIILITLLFLGQARKYIESCHTNFNTGGWVHPIEDMVVIFCQLFLPLLICPVHPFSFWCFTFFWTLCLIEEHSGKSR